ncbi:hypothetical protein K432DRAFT_12965 [Lepidopterella palustris CBS 459.81]|uniref:F-box domain-containing protein n=1 Tax=Lepidopterella palustris CBS 459.81 TaxID=1314670 RepID=A0A8E2JKU5_9PEZI|nr:hypothetical protein K432DRAFT_12965 [Lepidopterella palustris CBS 459.81]
MPWLGNALNALRSLASQKPRTCAKEASKAPHEKAESIRLDVRPPSLPDTQSEEYANNLQNSRLYQLPVELLLIVSKFILPEDILALRAAARDFHRILNAPISLTSAQKESYKCALRRDDYNHQCLLDRERKLPDPTLAVCSNCRELHPRPKFSSTQLSGPPETRLCKGAEGVVELCPHVSLTLSEIRSLCGSPHRDRDVRCQEGILMCTSPEHAQDPEDGMIPCPIIRVESRNPEKYLLKRRLLILTIERDRPVTKSALAEAILHIPDLESICPHLKVNDFKTHRPFVDLECPTLHENYNEAEHYGRPRYWGPHGYSHGHIRRCEPESCRQCWTTSRQCPVKHCNTTYTLFLRRHTQLGRLDDVVLTIRRYIGPVSGPRYANHPSWLAQIVEPEEQRDRMFQMTGKQILDDKVRKDFMRSIEWRSGGLHDWRW